MITNMERDMPECEPREMSYGDLLWYAKLGDEKCQEEIKRRNKKE